VWPGSNVIRRYELQQEERIVSYLPLSHVAAQLIDIVTSLFGGTQVFFAGPDALQGSLVETLKDIRPTFFFSVPRVWEKIDEKMKQIATSNGFVKKSIANWAKGMGREGTFAETHKLQPPFCFGLAKKLVYNNVKKALGLDQVNVTSLCRLVSSSSELLHCPQ
jgi:long-chain-fatty-acid--CoA ligase ACSBG